VYRLLSDRRAAGATGRAETRDSPLIVTLCPRLISAHDNGFSTGGATGADAIALANDYHPTAVSLDVFLPDMLGWTVLSQLKQNPAKRHIPVQIVTLEEDRQHALSRGAFSFITKPASSEGLRAALSRIRNFAEPRRAS
jgi:CheY-like chemotaxis protein